MLTSDGSTWTSVTPPALTTYSIGSNPDLGGYVFYVTPYKKHGLVAETIDQFGADDILSSSEISNFARLQESIN